MNLIVKMNQFQKELSVQSLGGEIQYRQFKFGMGKQMKPDVLFVNFQHTIGWLLREDGGMKKISRAAEAHPWRSILMCLPKIVGMSKMLAEQTTLPRLSRITFVTCRIMCPGT